MLCAGIDDIEDDVYGRLVVICHVWPGITPFNVFALSLGEWVLFRRAADEWVAARNKREG